MCGFFLIMKLVKLFFQLLACLEVPNDSYCCSSFSQCFLALLGAHQCHISTCRIALVPFVLSHGPQCVLVVPCHHPHRLIANLILLIVVMTFSQCCPSQTRTSPKLLPSPLGAEIQSWMLGSECLGGPNPGVWDIPQGHTCWLGTLVEKALLPWKKQEELKRNFLPW